jgi:hypothetical protein
MTTQTEALMPGPDDMARVGAWLVALTRLDFTALLALYKELVELPDAQAAVFRTLTAALENIITNLGLREDPARLQAVLADLAAYHLHEGNEN